MELKQRRFLKQGLTRFVILIPCLGIAIKVAKINFFQGLKKLFISPFHRKKKFRAFLSQLTCDSRSLGTFRYLWFRGINANWQEFWFYLKTRHPLLQPTYFSFFGLVNLQKLSLKPLKTSPYHQLHYLTDKKTMGEHHFTNPNNFCLENRKIKFLDYGDEEPRRIILEYGDIIDQWFDPDWDYEEYKKRRDQPSLK